VRGVIPAKAGIHPEVHPRPAKLSYLKMDSGLRRNDTVIICNVQGVKVGSIGRVESPLSNLTGPEPWQVLGG
jgi:hypothetical protein